MDQIKTGRYISELRKSKGYTQEELGKLVGVSNKTVSRWENGNYMPDIALLKAMSETFSVSLNELLSGRRLTAEEWPVEAEKNLADVMVESAFTFQQKKDFWTQRWLKQHRVLLILLALLYFVLLTVAMCWHLPVLAGISPLLALVTYAVLRNRMMIYVEDKLYGKE